MKKKRQPLTGIARTLRRRSTEAERRLWRALRDRRLDYKFRRQVPLRGCVVDFLCIKQRVVVELDGSQHASEEGRAADTVRDAKLTEAGFRVLRFWNHEVFRDLPRVLEQIWAACSDAEEAAGGAPSPCPSPVKGEGTLPPPLR